MRPRIAVIYNAPDPSRYAAMGEEKAVLGVLAQVEAVHKALAESGYPVERLPLSPPLEAARRRLEALKVDLVFNLFEGFDGCPETEASLVDTLSELKIPYTGSPGRALALALDKVEAKKLLEASGVDTPRYRVLCSQTVSRFRLALPCIVKPCREDASHGISEHSVVHDLASLDREVRRVSRLFGGKALVEEFIEGREFNVTVLGNGEPVVLPISEIAYSLPPGMPRVVTFAAKWEPESIYFQSTKPVCPTGLSPEEQKLIVGIAQAAFSVLGCRGYVRVDMRQDVGGQVKVLEVNPNPDISPDSGAALQAQASGLSYNQFIERITLLALEGESR